MLGAAVAHAGFTLEGPPQTRGRMGHEGAEYAAQRHDALQRSLVFTTLYSGVVVALDAST
jgi:hypothetical protein